MPQRDVGVPAGIVAAVHHVLGAVELHREPDADGVRRDGVGVHALEVVGRFLREAGGVRVLVHPTGLVRECPSGVRHRDAEIGVALHQTAQHQPVRRHADVHHPAEAEVEGAVVAGEHGLEGLVVGVHEDRDTQLLDPLVESLETRCVQVVGLPDPPGDVDADQAEGADGVLQLRESSIGVEQRQHAGAPHPARVHPLRVGHQLVVEPDQAGGARGIDVREQAGEGAGRGDHVDAAAQLVHPRQLQVQVGPVGRMHPGVPVDLVEAGLDLGGVPMEVAVENGIRADRR